MFSSVFTLCSLVSCNFELKSAFPTLKFLRARLRGDAAPFGVKVRGLPCSTVLDDRLLQCVVVVYAAPASVFLYRSSPTERCVLPRVIRTSPCSMPSCERGGIGWPLLANPPLSLTKRCVLPRVIPMSPCSMPFCKTGGTRCALSLHVSFGAFVFPSPAPASL
jgi:hypothetical protein